MSGTQQASWLGIPFSVQAVQDSGLNQKFAIHEYPYQIYPYLEAMGQDTRTISVRGYLDISGNYSVRDSFKAQSASQTSSGELILPTMGSFYACLVGSGFAEEVDKLGIVMLDLKFIITSDQENTLQSQISTSTQSDLMNQASYAQDDFSGDFLTDAAANVGSAVTTGLGYLNQVNQTLSDATRAISSVEGMDSLFSGAYTCGRYNLGSTGYQPTALAAIMTGTMSAQRLLQQGTSTLLGAANTARAVYESDLQVATDIGGLL